MKQNNLAEFVTFLKKKGYKVDSKVTAMDGGNGEFYIFQVKNNKEIPIFSNSSTKHPNAIVSFKLKPEKFEEILSKIIL